MKLHLPKPGRYIVAVSGGLDSTCLLDMMAKSDGYELIVAHYDHGIRQDSALDLAFVNSIAKQYGLKFVYESASLGPLASEATARKARYDFLYQSMIDAQCLGIITAHHQDDRIETLIINLIRGTGRKGLGSIIETASIKRPLLTFTKLQLQSYAHQHNLSWREDSTNKDDRYLRNYIRLHIMPRLSNEERLQFVRLMNKQNQLNKNIDQLVVSLLDQDCVSQLNRKTINNLTFNETKELVATWLRLNNLFNFDRKMIERLTLAAKTKRPGIMMDVYKQKRVTIYKHFLALSTVER